MKKISLVVPCYNEEKCVPVFYKRAVEYFKTIENYDYEIIFINDGSIDKTRDIINYIADKDKRVKAISLSRNFGQQSAMLCGFEYAIGDCVIELDCDLQDPIEAIGLMIEKWEEGYKLIHGRRRSREGDSFFKKVCAIVYNKLLMKLSGINVETRSGDFKLYDRQVVDAIVSLPENNKYMRGVSSWVGFKQCSIDFDRKERYAGETSFNFKKLVKLAKDGLVSNSNKPLSLPYYIGGFITFNSVLCFLIFTILCCCSISLPLLAWVFPTISFFFGLTFLLMSLSNCYLGKVYDQAKGRPSFIVEETKNIDNE